MKTTASIVVQRSLTVTVGALIVAFALLSGCGGSSGGGGTTVSLGPTVRQTAITAVETALKALPHTDPVSDANAMAAMMAARPEFSETGVDDEGLAWGVFTDGRLLIVGNNRPTPNPLAAAQAAATFRPQLIPNAAKAAVFTSMGNYFRTAYTANIATMLTNAGYATTATTGTLADYRALAGYGFVYVDAHGGKATLKNGTSAYALWTGSPWTPDLDSSPDFQDGSMCYVTAPYNWLPDGVTFDVATHVAITAKFINKYWHFAPGAAVYLDCCRSDNTVIRDACFAQGATVVCGWHLPADDQVAANEALFMTDRLLASHTVAPITAPDFPPQSFGDAAVEASANGIIGTRGSYLVTYFANQAANTEGLMPLETTVTPNDLAQTLTIQGSFSGQTGKVLAGSSALSVLSWSPTQIITKEPTDCSALKIVDQGRSSGPFAATCAPTFHEAGRFLVQYSGILPNGYGFGQFDLVPGATSYKIVCHGWATGDATPFPTGSVTFTYLPGGGGTLPRNIVNPSEVTFVLMGPVTGNSGQVIDQITAAFSGIVIDVYYN